MALLAGDQLLVTSIAASGLGPPWVAASNAFVGPPHHIAANIPKRCVFVSAVGGPAPEPGMHSTGWSIYKPNFQIAVRGNPNDPATPQDDARALMSYLHMRNVLGFFGALVLRSDPTNAGPDGHLCWMFTFDIELWAKEA